MHDPIHKLAPTGHEPLQAAVPRAGVATGGGAAFRALLEKLEQNARDVEAASRGVERPADLAAAVEKARSSLEDVLSLQDRLREAIQRARLERPG